MKRPRRGRPPTREETADKMIGSFADLVVDELPVEQREDEPRG